MTTPKIIIFAALLFITKNLSAQVTVNVNVGSPPQWGPSGYAEERYYYLPDIESYYDVQTAMFIYYGNGVWLHRTYLPSYYSNYDLYNGYKVVLTGFRGNNPYMYFNKHKVKYAKGYRGGPQKTIGTRPGNGNKKSQGNNKYYGSNGNGKNIMKGPGPSGNKNKGNGGSNGGHGGHGNGHGKK